MKLSIMRLNTPCDGQISNPILHTLATDEKPDRGINIGFLFT